MDDNLQAALKYLSVPAGSFWKWMDDGKVVTWTHGATIAFREELGAVLLRLSPKGLPQFDSVLMLIAATRIFWVEDSASLLSRLPRLQGFSGNLKDLMGQLNRVHDLPSDLIHPVEAKAALAEVVFESFSPVVTGESARMVCEILTHGLVHDHNCIPNLPRLRGGRVQSSKSLFADLMSLERGLSGISERSLRMRSLTGLDEPPLPVEVILPAEPFAIRTLLQKLALDDELCGLTRIARNLSAVLHLPRAISDSDEMPLGGVSDISNRGTLDRLLLSELAHDDLMLATRVALNEALYLRRETPPSPPPQRRHVLLDSGLRMWGVPRVYAAATMLSLAATGAEGASLLAYRAAGPQIVPVDPSTREGLVKHLESLESDVHPGPALDDFFQAVAADEQSGDAIVITSDAALADPEFQRALVDAAVPCYVAAVNREGELRIWSRGIRGNKLLTSLKLDLDELLKPPARPTVRLIDGGSDPNLPAIFRTTPFPFRLPHANCHEQTMWCAELPPNRTRIDVHRDTDREPVLIASESLPPSPPTYGVFVLARDRRLMLFDEPQRGAIQIADGLPFGKLLWSGSSGDQRLCYSLIHRPSEPAIYLHVVHVVLNRLITCQKLATEYLAQSGPGAQVLGAACRSGILFVIYKNRVEAFDLAEGRLLHHVDPSQRLVWKGNRFFYDESLPADVRWIAMSCDGSGIRFEQIRLPKPEQSRNLLRLFDRPGHDGPFGVHLHGSIASLSNQSEWKWTSPQARPVVLEIADDGNRILVEINADENNDGRTAAQIRRIRRVIQFDSLTCVDVPNYVQGPSLAAHELLKKNLGGSLMHRFTRIHVGTDGKLILTSKTQTRRQFVVHNSRLTLEQVPLGPITLPQAPAGHVPHAMASFEPSKHPNPGCGLTVATWQDGSRAFVDSRGLLHLQSSDRSLPEATLVLNDRDVAIWTSDGRVCGSPYFVDAGLGETLTPMDFVNHVLNPFIERLR